MNFRLTDETLQNTGDNIDWDSDFVYFPRLISDHATPETDDRLYRVADYEEDYYIHNLPERYGMREDPDGTCHMFSTKAADIDTSMGRFRKLTPRECLRLMGFDDSFRIAVSDTAVYRQAGNSIVVNVLMALLRKLDITEYGIDDKNLITVDKAISTGIKRPALSNKQTSLYQMRY